MNVLQPGADGVVGPGDPHPAAAPHLPHKRETTKENEMHAVPEPPTLDDWLRIGVVNGTMAIAQAINRSPSLLADVEVVAHFKPETDDDLRGILVAFSDFWEFDPVAATLVRSLSSSGGKARAEIDVSQIGLADVLSILDDTKPAF